MTQGRRRTPGRSQMLQIARVSGLRRSLTRSLAPAARCRRPRSTPIRSAWRKSWSITGFRRGTRTASRYATSRYHSARGRTQWSLAAPGERVRDSRFRRRCADCESRMALPQLPSAPSASICGPASVSICVHLRPSICVHQRPSICVHLRPSAARRLRHQCPSVSGSSPQRSVSHSTWSSSLAPGGRADAEAATSRHRSRPWTP